MTCECGLEPSTEKCCGRYIDGGEAAPTPEALMRSRYTAYVLGKIEHIVNSHNPESRDDVDPAGAEEWSKSAEWEGLEILHTEGGGEKDDEGIVEFVASYTAQGRLVRHRERAEFRRVNGRWYYHDGEMIKQKPMVRQGPKVGRNDPCTCGSGKKYKKCCGR